MSNFTNGAETTLNGAINNAVTSITVTSATGFPATAPFNIRIKGEGGNTNEICKVTAGAGTTSWTVTRASESYAGSSSASAHSTLAVIEHVLTASNLFNPSSTPGTWFGSIPWANSIPVSNEAHYSRITIPVGFQPNRIGLSIHISSGNLDLGVYNDDGTGANPGSKIITLGSTASPGTGTRLFSISPGLLLPGVYWLAFVANNGTISFGYLSQGTGSGGGGPLKCLRESSAFPLPATAGAGLSSTSWTAAIWLEVV